MRGHVAHMGAWALRSAQRWKAFPYKASPYLAADARFNRLMRDRWPVDAAGIRAVFVVDFRLAFIKNAAFGVLLR
jgi:hypothetical protein